MLWFWIFTACLLVKAEDIAYEEFKNQFHMRKIRRECVELLLLEPRSSFEFYIFGWICDINLWKCDLFESKDLRVREEKYLFCEQKHHLLAHRFSHFYFIFAPTTWNIHVNTKHTQFIFHESGLNFCECEDIWGLTQFSLPSWVWYFFYIFEQTERSLDVQRSPQFHNKVDRGERAREAHSKAAKKMNE